MPGLFDPNRCRADQAAAHIQRSRHSRRKATVRTPSQPLKHRVWCRSRPHNRHPDERWEAGTRQAQRACQLASKHAETNSIAQLSAQTCPKPLSTNAPNTSAGKRGATRHKHRQAPFSEVQQERQPIMDACSRKHACKRCTSTLKHQRR